MGHNEFKEFTSDQLEIQKKGLEGRIEKIRQDLRRPLDTDPSEQSLEITQRNIITSILANEEEYLKRINEELASRVILS